jgi:hypothetical protein
MRLRLLWLVAALHVAGLVFFGRGLLLRRHVLANAADLPEAAPAAAPAAVQARRPRAAVVVIDAWRHDMAACGAGEICGARV